MFLYSSVGTVCLKPNGDVVWAESNNVRDEQGNVLFTTSGISTIEMLNYDNNPTNTYFVGGSDYIYDDQGNLIYDSGGSTIVDMLMNNQMLYYSQKQYNR